SARENSRMAERETPQIQRNDLAATALALRDYGVRDLERFQWFEPPRPDSRARAERLLAMLGATDERGALTQIGRHLAALPLHPRLGRLLAAGIKAGLALEAATMAALLSERDILSEPHAARRRPAEWEGESDMLDRLELIENGSAAEGLDPQALRAVERIRDELMEISKRMPKESTTLLHEKKSSALKKQSPHRSVSVRASPCQSVPVRVRPQSLLRLLLHAYPDRVTVRRANDPSRGVMVGGRGVILEPSSVVRKAPLFLSIDPRDVPTPAGQRGAAGESRVSLASAIEEEWLEEIFPHLYERRDTCRFDPEKEKVLGMQQVFFAGLLIREDATGAGKDRESAAVALFEYLRRNVVAFFQEDQRAAAFLARIRFLRKYMPELNLPDFDTPALEKILHEACEGCATVAQARERAARRLIEHGMTWKQRATLDEHAPETITVPSGSRIRLNYLDPANPQGAAPPILAVRLQEMFGLAETPRIAAGRAPVTLHLLGPNFRPMQITSDLKNFWNTTYAEVRKQLRARYPRHPWPEDPWNAPPVSVGRRKRR
ncbi:MAG: ATP-dependent helicase HrpB, partial [Candidatus Sumerlaeota bacterium]|nr:ATP-dependent helicase HrpB [Candidatus Sumerlaeota bacterium]